MRYVYLLRSQKYPDQAYIGLTDCLEKRLESHNNGANRHTTKFKPWELVGFTAFDTREKAVSFEKYLKVGSSHAFAKRHFW